MIQPNIIDIFILRAVDSDTPETRAPRILHLFFPTLSTTIAKKLSALYPDIEYEEVLSWARIGFCETANGYDTDRFSTPTKTTHIQRVCAYLLTTGKNRAIDAMRSAGIIGRTRNGVWNPPTSVTIVSESSRRTDIQFDPEGSPDSPVSTAAMREIMAMIQPKLSGKMRELFDRVYVDGASIPDAAAAMGFTPARAFKLHSRAIEKARELLRVRL